MKLLIILLTLASSACTPSLLEFGGPTSTPTTMSSSEPSLEPAPTAVAEIAFKVTIPKDTPPDQPIQLSILDEVTGLALNPQRFDMQAETDGVFTTIIQVPSDTIIKYRYSRKGLLTAEEHTSDGRQVRYRLYHVVGSGVVEDVISRWNDTEYSGPIGRISGQVVRANLGEPIPNLMVTAGGVQTLTTWDGSYLLEGLPAGTHNLVVYALDGAYSTFQQGAIVAADATTPASINLTPAPLVEVTFNVTVPGDTIPAVPVRIAGNLSQLGNSYANLSGGISTPAARLPTLDFQGEGKYRLQLSLPAGSYVRYKYTLGDGFWNTENDQNGSFKVREFIIPEDGIVLEDQIETWKSKKSAPIWFDLIVPEDTPPEDIVSIQFNPFGWTQPIPMWRIEANRWAYLLSSPLDILGSVQYRYCRANQCGNADDVRTVGEGAAAPSFNVVNATTLLLQNLEDEVEEWQWMETFDGSVNVPFIPIPVREDGFVAGVEFHPGYHPSWAPLIPTAIKNVRDLGANWVILTPTWTFIRLNPPVLEVVTGVDAPWSDLTTIISQSRTDGLNVALFPTPGFVSSTSLSTSHRADPDQWWQEAPRDFAWWSVWFERYHTFAMHHAGLASSHYAETLILGGDWLNPALPNGFMPDGFSSGVPEDAEIRWREIISNVRTVYDGTIAWALPYPQSVQNPPPFLDAVDQIYLLWSGQFSNLPDTPEFDLETEIGLQFDNQLLPFHVQYNKPLIISVAYPSVDGGITGCVTSPDPAEQECLRLETLSRPNPDIPELQLDLQEQADAYNAILAAVNERDWIQGFVSRGYYPPVRLIDKSTSIHGKLAEQVLGHWFPRFLGRAP